MKERRRRPILKLAALILIAVLLGAGVFVLVFLRRNVPEVHRSIEEHFKYGSHGAEERSGVPLRIWAVLPKVFPEYLPDGDGEGYERVGFLKEDGRSRPIGTSLRKKPIEMVGLNCAVCHVGTVRDTQSAGPQIVLGMPANQFDLQGYINFLREAGRDSRFNADTLIPAIRKEYSDFPWWESLLHRYVVIPKTKEALIELDREFDWMDKQPPWGPGRVDTFNPYKTYHGFDMEKDDTVGTSDLPPIWSQRPREGMSLHWDGNNDSISERNKSAAIGSGASEDSLDLVALKRIEDWILDFPPPKYPGPINAQLAEQGEEIYTNECSSCHAFDGPRVGKVVPLKEIGTDPGRVESFTKELTAKMNGIGSGRSWQFSHFKKTDGYSSHPLDGVWIRAPFLHNGSVPTLRDLLLPPAERPTVFFRNYDLYDFENVGFVSSGPEAESAGFRYDTSVRGNSNSGHLYGTQLPAQEKDALLEYLKSL